MCVHPTCSLQYLKNIIQKLSLRICAHITVKCNVTSFFFSGAPKARAAELTDALTSSVYRFVSNMMFEEHVNLFSVALVLEKFRNSQKVPSREVKAFVNGLDITAVEENITFEAKPDWIQNKVYVDKILSAV